MNLPPWLTVPAAAFMWLIGWAAALTALLAAALLIGQLAIWWS